MKKPPEIACQSFKADRTTSKRIRYEFITVKSTTPIGLNSPRKNTTLPAIKCIEPRRTDTFFTDPCFLYIEGKCKIVSQGRAASHQ
ncbi:hypothetical protein TNCV_3297541 [Trichonephila clavipes]|uniref:Uncharacterized protein n=1 Tax=Trichonephila clavipes TaxID=2585209 RepID=A0A8X7B765_TRICX|nr:hypothetical protein TNCV_3297541 [Trichonephila clavipes]